ncbi:MAG: type II secretion system F family protein, partial [Clostridia bacterium]|nr:type II secretion system F family protein [Clostridia bacterium]
KHREKVLAFIQKVFPPLARLSRKLSASRVASVLSMMLSGGFPTGEALDMTAAVLTDKDAAAKVRSIRENLDAGHSFADAVSETHLFDELHDRMIKMGSATGREDQVLGKLAELYEEQAEDDITRLVSIIEPTLVALLSVVIGAVLLAVMLPMAGILSSL